MRVCENNKIQQSKCGNIIYLPQNVMFNINHSEAIAGIQFILLPYTSFKDHELVPLYFNKNYHVHTLSGRKRNKNVARNLKKKLVQYQYDRVFVHA